MRADLRCHYAIGGYPERRQHFEESDEVVTRKVRASFSQGLVPILCVGERLEERDTGQTERVVTRQVEIVIAVLLPEQILSLVIAYAPVWATWSCRASTGQD